jgi:hypothetical protein
VEGQDWGNLIGIQVARGIRYALKNERKSIDREFTVIGELAEGDRSQNLGKMSGKVRAKISLKPGNGIHQNTEGRVITDIQMGGRGLCEDRFHERQIELELGARFRQGGGK